MNIIYKITNLINGKIYIGQTTRGLAKRKNEHFKSSLNPKHKTYNFYIARAIRKYGFDNFKWEILYDNVPRDQLNLAEICAIYTHDSYYDGYNMTSGGDVSPVSNPLIAKRISEKLKGKPNPGVSKALKGRKLSKSQKANMWFHEGMKGKTHSEETRKKLSEKLKGRVAWNKGLTKEDPRVQKYLTDKSTKNRFKKGNVPWNKFGVNNES